MRRKHASQTRKEFGCGSIVGDLVGKKQWRKCFPDLWRLEH